MQDDLDQNYSHLDIQILGVNAVGHESQNELASSYADIPWLQDVDPNGDLEPDVWDAWQIAYRDVVVVDKENVPVGTFNLTTHNIQYSDNYNELLQMFVSTASGADFKQDFSIDGKDFLTWQRGGSPNPMSASDLAAWEMNYVAPGDFDLNHDVDGLDFLKWQRGESPNPLSPWDLATWEANYDGAAAQAAIAAVPEPGALALALLAIVPFLSRWR